MTPDLTNPIQVDPWPHHPMTFEATPSAPSISDSPSRILIHPHDLWGDPPLTLPPIQAPDSELEANPLPRNSDALPPVIPTRTVISSSHIRINNIV